MKQWLALAENERLGAAQAHEDWRQVVAAGEPAHDAFFLTRGAVEIVQGADTGASLVVKILAAPTLFGAIETISGTTTYLETVRSLGDATFHRFERETFLELLRGEPNAALECLTDMSCAFCAAARFEPSKLLDTDVLLANLLTTYAAIVGRAAGVSIEIGVVRTQAQLADCVGASERQVARVLKTWKERGWVTKISGLTRLLNPEAIAEIGEPLRGSLTVDPPVP